MPFARKALEESVAKKVASGQPLPDNEEGYREWREAYEQKHAGIYVVSVADAVSVAERTFQKGSGGEVTVHVKNGGRNQQFALYCAIKIAGQNITVLSAGSDGIDGKSPAAGAIADGATVERARSRGLVPQVHLEGFNAYPFFEALGDAITTGPTGNNLRDLRVILTLDGAGF